MGTDHLAVRRQRVRTAAAIGLGLLLTTGCGSEVTPPGGDRAGGDGPVNAEARALVEAAMAPLTDDTIEAPGPALTGVDALAGREVWFISLSDQIATMPILRSTITEALDTVGVTLRSCDGKANPSAIATCADQAALNDAAAVIFEGVDPRLTTQQVAALTRAGIPVVTDNQPNPAGTDPGDRDWAFVPGVAHQAMVLLADWVTVDSGGNGRIIFNMVSDGGPSAAFVEDGFRPELDKQCPDCTLVVNEIQTANFAKIPAVTSGALISNPRTEYVLSEFDPFVDPALAGIQATGRAQEVKGASTNALLPQLRMIADHRHLVADVGTNWALQAYAIADQTLRLMTGAEPVDHPMPVRLFTRDNVGDLDLSDEAFASGEWYGSTAYRQMYAQLWKGA